jgi:hypothetical protein
MVPRKGCNRLERLLGALPGKQGLTSKRALTTPPRASSGAKIELRRVLLKEDGKPQQTPAVAGER